MPRVRSPEREKAKELYLNAKGNIKLIDIAQQLGVLDTQIRKWKSQDKWDNELEGKGTLPNTKRNVTNKKVSKKKEEKEPISQAVKEVMENEELNDKQRLFCIYYSKSFNATKSYIKAYGCEYWTGAINGHKLLKNTKIKAQIDELTQIEMNREVLKRGLLQKYIDIAFADIKDYMEFGTEIIEGKNGEFEISVVKLKDSSGVDGTLISEVSQGKDGIKIKMLDKMKAMDFLSKYKDLLSDEEKTKLDIEYKTLQNEKAKAEINKLTGNNQEIEDTSEVDALLEGEINASN